jgi:hypothetical protein
MNDANATATLSRDQVLDELERLADVEHALIVEYLSVCCALGHDLLAGEGGATSSEGREAANTAATIAQGEMRHLKNICSALADAGRTPSLGRASSITDASGGQVPLDPPTADQLRGLFKRERAITGAVDAAYTRLAPALTPDLFDDGLLQRLRDVANAGATHAQGTAQLLGGLGDPPPPDFLRVPRRETNDPFEQRLLSVSDLAYRLVIDALRSQFAQPDVFGFRGLATAAMDALDASNKTLAQRGLLPAFTL